MAIESAIDPLLLLFGFLAGPVTHVVNPNQLLGDALLPIVSLCVGLILFEGGMSLRVEDLKQSGSVVWRMVSVGAVVSGVICATAGHYVAGVAWPIAALLARLAGGDRAHGHWPAPSARAAGRRDRTHSSLGRDRHRSIGALWR